MLSLVSFAGMTLDKCIVLRNQDVNWMSAVHGKSPPAQVKEPYSNLDTVTCIGFHPATRSVQSTLANNTQKRVWQYIEKERKKNVH